MEDFIPPQPPRSFRITLDLYKRANRLDSVLLAALKEQRENLNLQNISRTQFKALFNEGKIVIKGQRATPKSAMAKGVTYIDILGFQSPKQDSSKA